VRKIFPILKEAEVLLQKHGVESPRINSEILLSFVVGKKLFEINEEPSPGQIEEFHNLLRKRIDSVPLQHLTGTQQFRNVELKVGPGVFIPRPETELLIDIAKEILNKMDGESFQCLDVGTGSGAIPISLVQEVENVSCDAIEISKDALGYTKANISPYSERINLIHIDIFKFNPTRQYDFIISNPPYGATSDIQTWPEEVKIGDPNLALDGGDDGLKILRFLAYTGISWVKPGGWLIAEIGDDQGKQSEDLFKSYGWEEVEIKEDLTKRDRFIISKRTPNGKVKHQGRTTP